MTYLEEYLHTVDNIEQRKSIHDTSDDVYRHISKDFDYVSGTILTGLLFGQVQSGKTSQMLGVVSKLADEDFKLFIVLTTDNVTLQSQTFSRVFTALMNFDVYDESDEDKFRLGKLRKPTVIILKKNVHVLKKWCNIIHSCIDFCTGQPLVVLDDEADAASLNTQINSKDGNVSKIHKYLTDVRKQFFSGCIYIQVTATPQAVLLQSALSTWRPTFISYFSPGAKYFGGDFFFSNPPSYNIRITPENEIQDVKDSIFPTPEGLEKSLYSFLVTCAHLKYINDDTCNCMIHPSVNVNIHDLFANCISDFFTLLLNTFDEPVVLKKLKDTWIDLQKTQPNITPFEDLIIEVKNLLESEKINLIVLNSATEKNGNYNIGYNIVIGGNNLGRGITLPKLQTIYYCRKAKTPQADTVWQHSRIFGYDRIPGLVRIFLPQSLHQMFVSVNMSNRIITEQIRKDGLIGLQVLLPKGIRPTRPNVLKQGIMSIVTGGVNYFPIIPDQDNLLKVDSVAKCYQDGEYKIDFNQLLSFFSNIGEYDPDNWDKDKYINCIQALRNKRPELSIILLIKRKRDLSRGTGTMLSESDRNVGIKYSGSIVLTLYQVNGNKSKGWKGQSFWIPNIKFPQGMLFYDVKPECE